MNNLPLPPTPYPFPPLPFYPPLISLMVSVDVKHLISLMVYVDVKHHDYSVFPHLHTPPPFSPSLIILMVSVDVKHHVYLLTYVVIVSRYGLAVRRWAGKQRDLGSNPSRLFFLFRNCGLWTLSCDFVPRN